MPRGKRRLKLDVLGIELEILPAMRSRPLEQAGVLMRDHVAPVTREPSAARKWPLSCVNSCRWEAAWPLWHPRDANLACSSRSQGGEQRRVVARRVLPRGLLSPSVSERGSAPNLVHFGAVQDMGLWCLHWLLHPIAVNQPAAVS